MMKECLIERVCSDPVLNEHIAYITGEGYTPRPFWYRNKETGEEYAEIAGGLAWPGKGLPGFAVVVAALKETEKEPIPTFNVLEEVEESDIHDLFQKCVELRKSYLPRECSELLQIWYGDYLRFGTFVAEFQMALREKGQSSQCIYPRNPHDFDKPNRFDIYLRRLLPLLRNKKIFLGKCHKLRGYVASCPADAPSTWTEDDSPALAALGYVIHSLITYKPWLHNVESVNLYPWERFDIYEEDYIDYQDINEINTI